MAQPIDVLSCSAVSASAPGRRRRTNEERQAEGSIQILSFQASCNYIKGSCIRLCNNQWSVSQGDKEGIPPWFVAYERDHDSKEIDIISMMRVSRALKGGLGRMQ